MDDWLVGIDRFHEALARAGLKSHTGMRHGSMRVVLLAPRGENPQTPHAQDELYIVRRGAGVFMKNGERRPCTEGDVIFVEAGAEHRFEDFSEGVEAWAVFWGPEGGER